MYALDAATGSILWSYPAGSSVNAAPADRRTDRSTGAPGYSRAAEGSGNNKLYAFSIGGVVDTTAAGDDDRAQPELAERLERLVPKRGRTCR